MTPVPVEAVVVIPAIAIPVLALISGYRLGAALNVVACALTLAAAITLLFGEHPRSDLIIIDDFNIFLIILTAFVGFTTSIFSASYLAHEIETGRLTPILLRFYHAMYQALMCAMNVALIANNIGLMWVGVEVATLSTVMMVGIYRTPEALEAAWKYFILGSVGISLAFFGTILVYLVAQEVVGDGLPAMAWDLLVKSAPKLDPKLLSLAFVFLLVGYGTKVGLAPFHAWLPDAHAEGPTPISAVLSGLLLNVALYALLRFKMVLAGNDGAINVGAIMVTLGLLSLVFAAFMLYRRRDIKRLFAYSSIEHMGIAAFAFGMGGPLANFAGPPAHDDARAHQVRNLLRRRAYRPGQEHPAHCGDQRDLRHPSDAGGAVFPRRDRDRRIAAVRHVHERVFAHFLDVCTAAGAQRGAGLRSADRVRRAHPAAAGRRVRRAERQVGSGACILYSGLCASLAGAGRGRLAAGSGGAVVPRRRRLARMTAMSPNPVVSNAVQANPITAILGRFTPAANHRPWRRFDVDAQVWIALAKSLGDGAGDFLGLWGDTGAVHMALRTPGADPCVVSLAVERGTFPSVGRFHPAAIRLERAIADLYGFTPADAPDDRAWLDHGQWGCEAPLGAPLGARTPAPLRDPAAYDFLTVRGHGLHQIPVGPVHAGIIEPGHFRFTANGETVARLEARLGYVHKGIDGLLTDVDLAKAARVVARVSGDSTVALGFAFARAVEAALAA